MSVKLVGDVPKWHRELAAELREYEHAIDGMVGALPRAEKAKCYVSLAHDWYSMGAEEEGAKLLGKAEEICPGYFKNEIHLHTKSSEEFEGIVENIEQELKSLLLQGLLNGR